MGIFLGGGLGSAGNRSYLEKIAVILEDAGHQVFLPHRDGRLPGKMGKEKGLLSKNDMADVGAMVFEGNLEVIRSSDAIVAVLDGLCWGTTLEIGYAYAYKTFIQPKLVIIGIYTDPVNALDVMRLHACDKVLKGTEELTKTLSSFTTESEN